jgi:hypothetical protein
LEVTPCRPLHIYIATYLSVRDFEEFAYLGILLNAKNKIKNRVRHKNKNANRASFALLLFLKSQIIPRYVKIRIYEF